MKKMIFRCKFIRGKKEFSFGANDLHRSKVDIVVDWGDGSPLEKFKGTCTPSHIYKAPGTYNICILGNLPWFGKNFKKSTKLENKNLIEVVSFGEVNLKSLEGAFFNAKKLIKIPEKIPSGIESTRAMFFGATAFNQPLEQWDTSAVSDMSLMFSGALSFNQPLEKWDVSNVKNMESMFAYAISFNHPLEKWDVSNVTNMRSMFAYATAFNQSLNRWNISKFSDTRKIFAFTHLENVVKITP